MSIISVPSIIIIVIKRQVRWILRIDYIFYIQRYLRLLYSTFDVSSFSSLFLCPISSSSSLLLLQSYSKYRRTKIFCTIGPACWEVPQLETMIDAGMDVARFNFSHGDHEGHAAVLERVRHAAELKERNIGTYVWERI